MPPIKVSHFDAHPPATACSDYLLERTVIDALPERRGPDTRLVGLLPAMTLALVAPIDVLVAGFNASFMQCLINGT
jgi:hypothetical protein